MLLSHINVAQYKSPFRTTIRSLLLGREKKNDKFQAAQNRIELLEKQNQRLVNEKRQLQQRLRETQEEKLSDRRQPNLSLPEDPKPLRHNFGIRLITLCCELAKSIGFRSSEIVLGHVRTWLGSEFSIPNWTTMRTWLCRIGVAIINQAQQKCDDWIWMADHSVQLGDMKVFVILGIRQRDLPKDRPLNRSDMSPLALIPSKDRNKHEVAAQFCKLAEQVGVPISIVIDGATELHEGAKCFADSGKDVVVLDDIKHKAANILKKVIGKSDRFREFESHLGKTTASIQQTELAAFLPPKKKEKSRFMNLSKLLKWCEMTLDHLHHPQSRACAEIDSERFQTKLGWLSEYEADLEVWQSCQNVVSSTLEFSNTSGIYRGVTADLNRHLDATSATDVTEALEVRRSLVAVVSRCEQRLLESSHANRRLTASTEVLESVFGGYKRLQRDQTRGTFTSLLSALPTLTETLLPKAVKAYLETVSNAELKKWVSNAKLARSTQSQKTIAYNETKARKTPDLRQKNKKTLAKS